MDGPLLNSGLLNLLSCSHRSPRLEAFPAEHRAPLCRPEWNRCCFAALRAGCLGFRSHLGGSSSASSAFGTLRLACLASLGFVLESFVGEEHLFAGRKNELSAALRALQDLIVVFHEPFPPRPLSGSGTALSLYLWPELKVDL